MILRNLQKAPEKMIPVAITFVVVGMSILTIGIVWPHFSPSIPHQGTDWNSFFRGVIFGIVLAASAAAKKRN